MTDIRTEVSADIRRDVAESKARYIQRHPWRECPVCGNEFSLAGDCTLTDDTCCSPECEAELLGDA